MCLNYESRCCLQENMKTSWQYKRMLFHSSAVQANKIVPFDLADLGEGIKEVTVKEWLVSDACISR